MPEQHPHPTPHLVQIPDHREESERRRDRLQSLRARIASSDTERAAFAADDGEGASRP